MSAPEHSHDGWSAAQILALVEYVRGRRMSNAQVASVMGRTESAIATAVSRYCIRDPRAELRTCMPRERPFFSSHKGNRICSQCVRRYELECA